MRGDGTRSRDYETTSQEAGETGRGGPQMIGMSEIAPPVRGRPNAEGDRAENIRDSDGVPEELNETRRNGMECPGWDEQEGGGDTAGGGAGVEMT
ncbi:unnamed protein product [Lampetra planeri]